MSNTNDFRTRTRFQERENTPVSSLPSGIWPVGIDIGYSSVKAYSPNMLAQFPSFARKLRQHQATIGELPWSYVLYTDLETNEEWLVGECAQSDNSASSSTSTEILFSRQRYYDPMFMVLVRASLGVSVLKNRFGGPEERSIKVITGLPPAYIDEDSVTLKDAFSGRHHFSLKIGNSRPIEFDFTLGPDDVWIIPQPMGSLYSVVLGNDGRLVNGYRDYLSKSLLVFDPGFGTLDLFLIRSHSVEWSDTYDDLGMKQVLLNTIERIKKEYGVSYTLPAFQKCLETGNIRVTDRKNFTSKDIPFGSILFEESGKVCDLAIEKTYTACPLDHVDYLIVTGGTSSAWGDNLRQKLSGMENLRILKSNLNDPQLPLTFANVRGFYNFLYVTLVKGNR